MQTGPYLTSAAKKNNDKILQKFVVPKCGGRKIQEPFLERLVYEDTIVTILVSST